MQTYTAFFNTEPQVGSVVVGITASLEEAKANGADDINAETINGLRAGLMGPLAGIGDSLVVGTLIPIFIRYCNGSIYWRFTNWGNLLYNRLEFTYYLGYEIFILQRL